MLPGLTRARRAAGNASPALKFVLMVGIMSFFADFTYEGSRSITGPYLGLLGASAFTVSVVSGGGEFIGYNIRLLSGRSSDRTGMYWPITIGGYILQMSVVPLLALAGTWQWAAVLIIAERIGKGIRNPPRDAMLSHAAKDIGYGWAFGVHESLDQFGAMFGPLLVALVLAVGHHDYKVAFAALAVPAVIMLSLLAIARVLYPRPQNLGPASGPVRTQGLPRVFWIYAAGAALAAAGFADYPLISLHFEAAGTVSPVLTPVFYAVAMAVSGTGSLVFGRMFDRAGIGVLIPLTLVTAVYAPLVFLGGFWAILAGSALWGLGMGVQESLIPAAVAPMVAPDRRASAYGLFTGIYGTAWVAGSIVIGVLVSVSPGGLVAFCIACELASIPLILLVRARTRPAGLSKAPAGTGFTRWGTRFILGGVRRRGSPLTAVTANGPCLLSRAGGRMLMVDRAVTAAGAPGDGVAPCRYCTPGRETEPAGDEADPAWLAHLYLCRGLSTYAIGQVTGLDRQRVTRMLRKAQVPLRPRGAGRLRPLHRDDPPGLRELLAGLYEAGRLGSPQIAAITGIPERTVRDRLRRYGIAARTRGGWNREDRQVLPAKVLGELYTRLGLTAGEVGRRLGTSRSTVLRSAHALGVPVRAGGAVPVQEPDEIELVLALYADPLIAGVLEAHGIPRVPAGGPIWERFPVPVPLTTPLVKDLYLGCGVGLDHIELLTGQPAETVRRFMARASIALRGPGGQTPFLRRWRRDRPEDRQRPP